MISPIVGENPFIVSDSLLQNLLVHVIVNVRAVYVSFVDGARPEEVLEDSSVVFVREKIESIVTAGDLEQAVVAGVPVIVDEFVAQLRSLLFDDERLVDVVDDEHDFFVVRQSVVVVVLQVEVSREVAAGYGQYARLLPLFDYLRGDS